MSVHIYIYTFIFIYTYILYTYVYIYTYMYIHIYTYCIHICINLCVFIYTVVANTIHDGSYGIHALWVARNAGGPSPLKVLPDRVFGGLGQVCTMMVIGPFRWEPKRHLSTSNHQKKRHRFIDYSPNDADLKAQVVGTVPEMPLLTS